MAKYKVGILGHYGGGQEFLDGQTIKTKNITSQLRKELGETQVLTADTYGGVRTLPKCLSSMVSMLMHCENIIILPAQNGLKVFPTFLVGLNPLFRKRLHYVVIGGWLNDFLENNKLIEESLRSFSGIYVETRTMKKALEARGMNNVYVMPNFKDLRILSEDELLFPAGEPYRLCTFSRVMKEKGIGDAVEAVKAINQAYGRTVFMLDIYGQIDSGQTQWFEELKTSFPQYVRYKGLVPFDKSVDVLKDYFALLFPTKFYTEGIPGTILDAYAAGVPVISARWENFADVVDHGTTGVGYEFGNQAELLNILCQLYEKPELVHEMKKNCVFAAQKFTPSSVIKVITERI